MKILCLTDFVVSPPRRWLWDFVPGNEDEVDFLHTRTFDRFPKWGKIITSYPLYFSLAWKASQKLKRNDYDLIVAWESDTGFPLGIIRKFLGQKKPGLVILTFSIRGPIVHFKWLQEFGVSGVDYFTVPSRHEATYYSQTLGIPKERFFYCPYGAYDIYQQTSHQAPAYIFSGGRSGRDYGTFLEAVSHLPIPVILNARPFNLKGKSIPSNVTVNDILPFGEYRDLNCGSSFVVVPLMDTHEAVGITAILYAMSAGKAVISTRVPSVLDYIQEDKTGLLVSPGDAEEMRSAIEYLWGNSDIAQQYGERARQVYLEEFTFEKFARNTVKILEEINQSTNGNPGS